MNSVLKAWRASFVRRWHTHPLLSKTDDYICGHQQRTAMFLLQFWPDSTREAIIDALIHDQGEDDGGDVPHPAKAKFPELRTMVEEVERQSIDEQGFDRQTINDVELRRRKWADRLDSYLWMLKNEPHLRKTPDWQAQLNALSTGAFELSAEGFHDFITEATEYMTGETK